MRLNRSSGVGGLAAIRDKMVGFCARCSIGDGASSLRSRSKTTCLSSTIRRKATIASTAHGCVMRCDSRQRSTPSDRNSVGSATRETVRVEHEGRRLNKKKKLQNDTIKN